MPSGTTLDPSILSMTVKPVIPIGTIIYFFLRKRFTLPPLTEMNQEPPEPPIDNK